MSPITLSLKHNYDDLMNAKLTLSEKKMYKKDPNYSYHNILHDKDQSSLQIVVSEHELPIVYASGSNAILVKLRKSNKLLGVLKSIEDKIRACVPPGMYLSSLVKEPDQESWAPSFKLKTDRCMIHKDSTGGLRQGCVIQRCLISITKVNHYQGKYYYACQLKSAKIGSSPSQFTDDEEDEDGGNHADLEVLDE